MSGNSPLKNYGWQIGKALISIMVVITYSRFLGADGRGQMSIYLLYLQFILMLGELLAGSAMANWLVKYKPGQILPWMVLYLGAVILICGVLMGNFFEIKSKILFPLLIQGMGLAILNVQFNIYQSRGWILRRNKLQLMLEITKLLTLLIVVFLLPLNVLEAKVQAMLMVLAFVTLFFLGISIFKTLNIWGQAFEVEQPPTGIFFEGLWAQLGHVILFFINKLPLWLIAKYLGNTEAGIFANALLIADTIWIFSGSFGTVIHSRVIRSDRKLYHERLLRRYIDFSFLGTLTLCFAMLLIPNIVFVGIFGANFVELKLQATWLIPGILFMGISASVGNYLHAVNRFKTIFVNHLIALLAMLVFFYGAFLTGFSVAKVAFGMSLGYFILMLLHLKSTNWLFKNDFKLKFNILLIRRLFLIKMGNKG